MQGSNALAHAVVPESGEAGGLDIPQVVGQTERCGGREKGVGALSQSLPPCNLIPPAMSAIPPILN